MTTRCAWASSDPLTVAYHDEEWGVPCHDERKLFEMLMLEGAQAGLSWLTILKKRENYRKAFHNFDARKVARYDERQFTRLMGDAGIVRNKLKIAAAIQNAQVCLAIQKEVGSLDAYFWQFVGSAPKQNAWRVLKDIPAKTAESNALSEDLVRRGCRFVGSTICYAFMQATGMVNDHTIDCFRYHQVGCGVRSGV